MTISTRAKRLGVLVAAGVFISAVGFSGCTPKQESAKSPAKRDGEKQSAACPQPVRGLSQRDSQRPAAAPAAVKRSEPSEEQSTEWREEPQKPRDLGPPLVDEPERLVKDPDNTLRRLSPTQPIWVDLKNKCVVLQGEVCQVGYPLEFFATYSNRAYESVVAVNVTPSTVHAGLLSVGAEPGHPAQFQPKFVPPAGTEIAIEVRWKDAEGKVRSAPAQHWIRDIKTKKELDCNWVFAGSQFRTDEETGKEYYLADSGELICVLSLSGAMLDLPRLGYGALESRTFEAFAEHMPPKGTPTTLLLKPVLASKPGPTPVAVPDKPNDKPTAAADEKHAAEVQKAVETAEPWLAQVDRGEYSAAWTDMASRLKAAKDRRDSIKLIGAARKPLGKFESRRLESKRFALNPPNMPNGRYVVLEYATAFANRKASAETVTLMLDKDKKWRVVEYYIR
jgi:hypothetical protein